MEPDLRHSFARVLGVRLHWVEMRAETDESAEAPPIVLLHGLNDCHLTWQRVASELGQNPGARRRVLIPDLPGHGLSERPDVGYELRWYARVMAAWFAAVGVPEADVVGHSFGGGVAQAMLLECRDRIRRLALVSSGGLGREVAFVLRLASITGVVERLGQPFMGPGTRLVLKGYRNLLPPEQVAEMVAMNARDGSARAFARTVRDIIDWRGQRRTFFQRAHEIAELPPIGVFWGDRDPIIPVAHGRALAESVQGVRLVLFEGCGHYLHREEPEALARALRRFFDEAATRPSTRKG